MNLLSLVAYRNPLEEWLWESGTMYWIIALLLSVLVLSVLVAFAVWMSNDRSGR